MQSFLLLVKNVVVYSLYTSVKIGQFIVTFVNWTLHTAFAVLAKFSHLCTVLVEDFIVFLQDFFFHFKYITNGLIEVYDTYLKCVAWLMQETLNTVNTVTQSLSDFHDGIASGMAFTGCSVTGFFVSLKQIIVMFGEGSWFLIVFIPKSIYNFIILCLQNLIDSVLSLQVNITHKADSLGKLLINCMRNIYDFITDVSTESVLGLAFGLCCIYIFVQFYMIMLNYVRGKIVTALRFLGRLLYRTKLLLNRVTLPKMTKRLDSIGNKNRDVIDDDDRLCVICQDHSRCILILPCKHFCMCEGCSVALRQHNASCPICRKRIRRTIKVFT